MSKNIRITRLTQAYEFPGFCSQARVEEVPVEQRSVAVKLRRRYQKKDLAAPVAAHAERITMTRKRSYIGISTADSCGSMLSSQFSGSNAWNVAR